MKTIKRISILLIIITVFTSINFSKAFIIETQETVAFDATKGYEKIYYNEKVLSVPIAKVKCSKGEFPIYALKQEKSYLKGTTAFYTKINGILENDEVRTAVMYGYPNNTFQSLGCTDEKEAYIITQIAVFDAYYHYDLEKFSTIDGNIYENIIDNLTKLITKVRNNKVQRIVPELKIQVENEEWQIEDDEKESKTYEVVGNVNIENYTIKLNIKQGTNIQILNEQNEPQKKFLKGEKFKIILPKQSDAEFEIQASTELETNPLLKGKELSENWETYVILGEKEEVNAKLLQEHKIEEDNNEENKNETTEENNGDESIKKDETNSDKEIGIMPPPEAVPDPPPEENEEKKNNDEKQDVTIPDKDEIVEEPSKKEEEKPKLPTTPNTPNNPNNQNEPNNSSKPNQNENNKPEDITNTQTKPDDQNKQEKPTESESNDNKNTSAKPEENNEKLNQTIQETNTKKENSSQTNKNIVKILPRTGF